MTDMSQYVNNQWSLNFDVGPECTVSTTDPFQIDMFFFAENFLTLTSGLFTQLKALGT